MPKLVRNAKTTAVRAAFTDLSQAFRDLTASQIAGWNALGTQFKKRNSLGVSYDLTGLQAYKSLNQRNIFLGNPVLETAPAFAAAPDASGCNLFNDANVTFGPTTVTVGATSATQEVGSTTDVLPGDVFDDTTATVTANVLEVIDATHVLLDAIITTVTADSVTWERAQDLSIRFDPSPIPADVFLLFYATAPLSAGVTRPSKSAFRFIGAYTNPTTSHHNVMAQYSATWGSVPPGTNVFGRFVYVTLDGFAGTPFETDAAA